jgi:TonB family protein
MAALLLVPLYNPAAMKPRPVVLLAILLSSIAAFSDTVRKVSSEEATNHLIDRVAPKYPAIAESAHVQGTVALGIDISESGTVTDVNVLSGHPILIVAAIDAVKKWRYKPFLIEGTPAAVHTITLVPFYMGKTPDTRKLMEEAESADLFQQTLRLCRMQLRDRQPDLAETTCKKALALTFEPSWSGAWERYQAYEQIGHAFFMQGKFPEALENYQQWLRPIEKDHGDDDGDVAAARHHVANALWRTSRTAEARRLYEKSERGYRKAIKQADSFFRDRYATGFRQTLLDHAAMLRELGETSQAESLEKESAAIVVKDDPKQVK